MLPQNPPGAAFDSTNVAQVLVGVRVRHRDVAGQDVVERRDVGRALDRGVPAQRQDAAAGPADVAQQQLHDRGGADVLHADGVLRPAHRVARSPTCARGRSCHTAPRPRSRNCVARDAARLLDQLGRVAAEVLASAAGRRSADARAWGPRSGGSPCRSVAPCAAVAGLLAGGRAHSRWPAAPRASMPSYCQVVGVVGRSSRGPSPRTGRPGPRCRGSRSSTITGALVYSRTYSRNSRPFSRM